ncbi:MAG: hypothetical protein IPL33_04040 [Sphingobacteriales bacterium]|nr:hypothetical protein [Sphingobacteriales bacterium]
MQLGQNIDFILEIENDISAVQPMQDAIIYDLFPNTIFEYLSWNYIYGNYTGTPPVFTHIPNYRTIFGVPHDLLKWEFPDDFAIGEDITMQVNFKVKETATPGQATNRPYITSSNSTPGVCGFAGFAPSDQFDVDNDGNTSEEICNHDANVFINSSALLTSEKLVKGQLDAVYSKYPLYGYTVPGGLADYRLRVRNEGNIPMTDILVIDILPWIGDVGVLDPQTRDTDWRPNLAGPVTPPTGVTVYYSTENNPCRSELGYSPGGCTGPTWSLTPPIDITTVQSLKFDFGSIVLQPGDSLILAWPMRAPVNAPTNNEIAWNSFGYIGTRTDNNQTLLPSEPLKVGIVVQPLDPAIYGDYVWLDIDQDGIKTVASRAFRVCALIWPKRQRRRYL